jgi:leucyl aminopeptidase (aminopeptidase T)
MRRLLAFALLVSALAMPAAQAPAPPAALKSPPPIDFARWARFIVRDFFAVQPYEKVVLMTDPTYYPELTDAIRAELLDARAIEIGSILFDGRDMSARRSTVRPRATDERYRNEATTAMRKLYEQADIFMWLPYRFGPGTERGDGRMLERLVEGTRARGLHFHWIENLGQLSQADIDETTRLYADALDIDYAALSARQDRLIARMRGRELRVTSPLGTDLRVRVTDTSWIHKGDGRMDAARAAQAKAVRDREMELPAGALRFVPDVNSAEGVLVVPRWSGGEDVRFEFRQGRVTGVTSRTGQEQVAAAWARATGDKDRIAEMVIGTNPRLPAVGPAGRLPYYGYGAGMLRIALGENWESGGTNRSSLEAWFYLSDTTVAAGETVLIRDGKLVIG